MDNLTQAQRRKNMRAIRSKDSKIEILLRKALWKKGFRYRKNYTELVGRPDIVLPKNKTVIFCDGEFWHGYDWLNRKEKLTSNRDYWIKKIERNLSRDKEVDETLKLQGWHVIRFWGKDIQRNLAECIRKIEREIGAQQMKEKKKKLRLASFFAGVGGIELGFEKSGGFKTVYANEIDPYPIQTYEQNFNLRVDNRDIRCVLPENVPDVDIIVGGFPCQAFSIAGYRQGFKDERGRGTLFFELLRIIHHKKPRIVFLENVKNLVGHDNGNTFKVIRDSLETEGYHVCNKVLNAMDYGNTPQNRERIYIVAFKRVGDFRRFKFPDAIKLTKKLGDVIDFKRKIAPSYYYTKGKYKGDIYDQLIRAMDDPNAIYQWRRRYVRKNMSGVVPTLTANMGEGGHNVPLVKTKHGIRKLTPHECFNAQGFPENFKLPDMAESRLYKQAGNSVCVGVIERIAEKISSALTV